MNGKISLWQSFQIWLRLFWSFIIVMVMFSFLAQLSLTVSGLDLNIISLTPATQISNYNFIILTIIAISQMILFILCQSFVIKCLINNNKKIRSILFAINKAPASFS